MASTYTLFFLLAATFAESTILSPFASRILGGEVADISKHPYLVSIRVKSCSTCAYLHKCGGSINTDKVIITAAQCIVDLGSKDRLMVVAGANTRAGSDGVQLPVAKTISHAGYNFWTIDNDIGLVVLEDALPLNDFNIKPIAVAAKAPLGGKLSTVSGWGRDAEDGADTYFLVDVDVPIVSNEDCDAAYGHGEVTANMICAGARQGGKDACQHDTGGPLVVDGKLVGLVSWGRGCGRQGYPSVYTSVASYSEWIAQQIAGI